MENEYLENVKMQKTQSKQQWDNILYEYSNPHTNYISINQSCTPVG